VPVAKRRAWVAAEHEKRARGGDSFFEDVEDAMRLDQGIDDDRPPSRLLRIAVRRPWGLRPRVIADVAKELGVSARIVERAWKQFRAHARRFAAGLRTDE
jgi:hypothetical protein